MKKGNNLSYEKIVEFCENNDFEINDYGAEFVGENVLVIKKDRGYGLVATFVLVSMNQWECVYIDFNPETLTTLVL